MSMTSTHYTSFFDIQFFSIGNIISFPDSKCCQIKGGLFLNKLACFDIIPGIDLANIILSKQ